MKHRFLKMATILMTLSLLSTVSCRAVEVNSIKGFSDVPKDYWGYQTITEMTELGLFKGTTEPVDGIGTFSPEKVMTRAEFITVALRAVYPKEAQAIENDSEQWWRGYYVLALDKDIIGRAELDYGDLDQPMTREEMAMVMVRCVAKNGEELTQRVAISQIADYAQIGKYYKEYVRDCFSFGLLCGVDSKGTFAPTKSLTRVEATTVLCRLLDKDMRVEVKFMEANELNDGEQATENGDASLEAELEQQELLPWENGGKKPENYTWEEFEALNGAEQEAFVESFGSAEAFEKWENSAIYGEFENSSQKENGYPWEIGGKQPEDYTWEEFEALNGAEQEAFVESFESAEAFEKWENSAVRYGE